MEWLSLGPTPTGETCEQIGPNYDPIKAKKECRIFIDQLMRAFPSAKIMFKIKNNPHEFGTYFDVEVGYDENDEDSIECAFEAEAKTPEHWDEEAKKDLENRWP